MEKMKSFLKILSVAASQAPPPSIPISLVAFFTFYVSSFFSSFCLLSERLQLSGLRELTGDKETFWMGILMPLTTDSVCPDVSLEGNVRGFIYEVQACVYVWYWKG